MTIAIGMLARGGMVIAADTEESTGDYMKGQKGKVACFYSQDGKPGTFAGECVSSCAVAGAGNSGYVQGLIGQLGDAFIANPELQPNPPLGVPQESLQSKFSECIHRFYREHIIPFASYPERKRPDVEMLIAVQRKTIFALFASEKTVLNSVMPYKAIGWGSTFAELLLDKLWCGMSVEQAEVLAAYIVFMTKESVETCGKYTTIATFRSPKTENTPSGNRMLPTQRAEFVRAPIIEEWEHAFKKKWWTAERQNIFSLIDNELTKQPTLQKSTSRRSKGRQ